MSMIDGTNDLRDFIVSLVRRDDRDLTLRQLAILFKTHTNEADPYTVRRFAAELDIKKPAVTRAVTRLLELGLVTRERDPKDARSVIIGLTPEGAAYIASATEVEVPAEVLKEAA